MTADDVVEVLNTLEDAGIDVWLDGGWAVDALVGEQTRDHDDLDLVARSEDAERAISVLEPCGYGIVVVGDSISVFGLLDCLSVNVFQQRKSYFDSISGVRSLS